MASAARVVNEEDEADTDSEEDTNKPIHHTADLSLIKKTLEGIAAHSADEGALGVGRHASTILLGRHLWETPPLDANAEKSVAEPFFNDTFPPAQQAFEQAL